MASAEMWTPLVSFSVLRVPSPFLQFCAQCASFKGRSTNLGVTKESGERACWALGLTPELRGEAKRVRQAVWGGGGDPGQTYLGCVSACQNLGHVALVGFGVWSLTCTTKQKKKKEERGQRSEIGRMPVVIISYLREDLALVRVKDRHGCCRTCGKLWLCSLLFSGADTGTVGLTA
ncbi:unnamed protein product [Arctogadus glacialis]